MSRPSDNSEWSCLEWRLLRMAVGPVIAFLVMWIFIRANVPIASTFYVIGIYLAIFSLTIGSISAFFILVTWTPIVPKTLAIFFGTLNCGGLHWYLQLLES